MSLSQWFPVFSSVFISGVWCSENISHVKKWDLLYSVGGDMTVVGESGW
jgi:hypothetical protein